MRCRRKCCRNFGKGDITIEELKAKVLQGAILLDVRSNQEYNEGHLQGSINIPEYEIMGRVQREIPKKNQLIVVYCQYGGRSKNVVTIMNQMGYNNIYNLHGGLDSL